MKQGMKIAFFGSSLVSAYWNGAATYCRGLLRSLQARGHRITDAWEGIEQFLEPEREVLVARSGAEVAAQLEALSPARAWEIGRAAQRRILAQHTYAHRAAQLDALLGAPSTHRDAAPTLQPAAAG